MTPALTLTILGFCALILFVSQKWPSEVVAVALLVSLPLVGILSPKEAMSGYSHPALIQTGAFLVLSVALARTGVLSILAGSLFKAQSARGLVASILLVMALSSPWISNTALVALFIPILTEIGEDRGIPRSKFMIPVSYGAIFGGVVTTIGTSSHIFGASLYTTLTGEAMHLFTPAPFALTFFVLASILILAGLRLLPAIHIDREADRFDPKELLAEARIVPGSPLIGRTALGEYLRKTHDLTIVALRRGLRRFFKVPPKLELAEGDILLLRGGAHEIEPISEIIGLEIRPDLLLQKSGYASGALEYVEVIVGPNARDVNRPISKVKLLQDAQAAVLAVRRRGRLRKRRVEDILLSFGDVLILQGPKGLSDVFQRSKEFIFQREIELPVVRRRRMPIAIATLIAVLVLGGSELVPMPIIAMAGAVVVVLTGCLTPKEMHRALPWNMLIMIGALVPLSIAVERSGLAAAVAEVVVSMGGSYGPRAALLILAAASLALAQLIQPNGVIAVMLPLAVATARHLGVAPLPFALAVLFGGGFSLATPFAYNTNMMVTVVAAYRAQDFLKLGVPLLLLALGSMVALIPIFYPF